MPTPLTSRIEGRPEAQVSCASLLALIRSEMHERAAAGAQPRVEDYFEALRLRTTDDNAVLDLLLSEYLIRSEHGESPTASEYADRFPHLADRIRVNLVFLAAANGLPRTQIDPALVQTPVPAPLNPYPLQVPGYEILDILGQGGMGVVYKARQIGLNRTVALKMVLAGRHAVADDRARFRLEAEAVAALQHPNIVQVYEIGEHDGSPYFSLEYVDGGTLARAIDGKPQDPLFAAQIVEQLARAMHTAHEQNIIHRDLKPANVLLAGDRRQDAGDRKQESGSRKQGAGASGSELSPAPCLLTPKVTDFGLAKRLDSDNNLTVTGVIAGTPQYMAPEQVTGVRHALGPWTDIHALGVILYEMLTGRPPYLAPDQMETLHRVVHDAPTSPRHAQQHVPRDLETICLKCLEKSPFRRYMTAADLADDLLRFQNGEPIVARPVGTAERGWRWCRRNPRLATSLATLFLTLVLGITVSTFFAVQSANHASDAEWSAEQFRTQKLAAEDNARQLADQKVFAETKASDAARSASEAQAAQRDADKARAEETRLKQDAIDREQVRGWELFGAHMALAQRALNDGNVLRLNSLLDRYVPASPGAIDLRGFEWYYLRSMQSKHTAAIPFNYGPARLVGSADGRRALWYGDTVARLDDFLSEPVTVSYPREKGIDLAAYSPDGKYLVTVSTKHEVQVRDGRMGNLLRTLPFPGKIVRCLQFSHDGKTLAAGGGNEPGQKTSQCVLWAVGSWDEVFRLPSHCNVVTSVAFTRNDSRLVVAGTWFSLTEWDITTGESIQRRSSGPFMFSTPPALVASSPTQELLAVSLQDSSVHIVHPRTWETLRVLKGMYGPAPLVFSPDGRTLACGSQEGPIWLWDATTGELKTRFRGHMRNITGLAFDAQNQLLYSSSEDYQKLGWPLDDTEDYRTLFPRFQIQVQTLLPPIDQEHVPCVHHMGFVGMADLKARRWSRVSKSNEPFIVAAAALLKATNEVLLLGVQGQAKAVHLGTGDERPVAVPGLAADLMFGHATPDGSTLVTAHRPGVVQVHRLDKPATAPVTVRLPVSVIRLAVRPDGKQFALAEETGAVRVYDSDSGAVRYSCETTHRYETQFAFSPDNRTLVVAGYAKDPLRLWDTETGRQVRVFDWLPWAVSGIKFTPDGRRLAIWVDRTIAFRDVATGMETLTLHAPDVVTRVEFTPDGCGMVSADGHDIRFWSGRRAFFQDWIQRMVPAFRVRDLAVEPPAAPGQMLKLRFSLTNVTGRPFRLPPNGGLGGALSYPCSLRIVQFGRSGTPSDGRVVYSSYPNVPIPDEVAPGGAIEYAIQIPTASWPPGRYQLTAMESVPNTATHINDIHRIEFEVK